MVTCFIKYIIDPKKVDEFQHYGKLWIDLVNRMDGLHHGYLIPHEGPNNVCYATFSFPTLAKYEEYRNNQKSAMCLSTIDQYGYPNARFVDLKSIDSKGVTFCRPKKTHDFLRA